MIGFLDGLERISISFCDLLSLDFLFFFYIFVDVLKMFEFIEGVEGIYRLLSENFGGL